MYFAEAVIKPKNDKRRSEIITNKQRILKNIAEEEKK